ncbi:MAG: site-specific integrase [Chitinophagaceae bacterium]
MLLPITPICSSSKIRRDGTSLVFIQYCKSADNKTLLNTEIAIPSNFWHKKLKRITEKLPEQFGKADELNAEVKRQIRLAEDIISFAIERKMADPVKFVKAVFKPDFDLQQLEKEAINKPEGKPKLNKDFFFQLEAYIKSKESTVAPATLHILNNLKDILLEFQVFREKIITFDEINLDFYEEYSHYLTYEHIHKNRREIVKGLKTNTIGKNIKQLIVFLKNRKQKRIITELDLSGFKIVEEDADAIYLTPEEINTVLQMDLSGKPHLCKYRDLLVFGCLTGLRFSDFSIIRSEDVRDGMLYKKQIKTKHWVVVPLRDEANHIFINSFNRNIPVISNADFNYYIKEVGKVAGFLQPIKHSYLKGNKTIIETKPKYQWITSHTCRRSFCTNEFLAGTPVELIMKISGHKSLKDFYRYIKIAPEQAGQRIKELWQKRGELSVA